MSNEKLQQTFTFEADEDDGLLHIHCYLPNQTSYVTTEIRMDTNNLVEQVKVDILRNFNPQEYHMVIVSTDGVIHMRENEPITYYYDELQKGDIKFVNKPIAAHPQEQNIMA